jgi:hypothetical protein
MEQLKAIGYLDYTEVKRGKAVYFCIHYRRPKLRPAQIPTGVGDDVYDVLADENIVDDPAQKDADSAAPREMVMLTKEELELLEQLRQAKK